jgi:Cu/Ag efflux protein CusF
MAFKSMTTAAAVFAAGAVLASAQTSITKPGAMQKGVATIMEIDAATRLIKFKKDDGTETSLFAPKEVARFNELKVGDRVNYMFYESTTYQIQKPGAKPMAEAASKAVTGTAGALGGTVGKQTKSSVTVKSVDMAASSLTVTGSDGRTITTKVANKAHLEGVKPGDRIDITYTEALLVTVDRAK